MRQRAHAMIIRQVLKYFGKWTSTLPEGSFAKDEFVDLMDALDDLEKLADRMDGGKEESTEPF